LCEENEAQVATFLASNPGFRLVPLPEAAPHLAAVTQSGHLSLTPARHGTDGFFAAVLRRDVLPAPSHDDPTDTA
jgi:16S rRNA (cytosine967-C5)-methyltransferase